MPENQENKLYQTNNYSIVSKYSAVKNGYFKDPILEDFVENWLKIKSWRRAPIVNRGYAARLLAMDWAVDRIIRCHNVGCAIVLGAGYDMTAFRRIRQTQWIEIDLPQVVEVKLEFIRAKFSLKPEDIRVAGGSVNSIESLNYHLISCDITDTESLREQLVSVLRLINRRMDVAIINEVCLCYIQAECIERILRTTVDTVRDLTCRAHYIGFEQVNPSADNKYFSGVMLNHFTTLGHPIKHYPTTQELINLFKVRLSFQHLTVINMHNVFHNILADQTHDHSGFSEEPFDEFEEMDLYLAHYKLVMATIVIRDPFTGEELAPSASCDEVDLCEDTNKYLKVSNSADGGAITGIRAIKNKQLQRFGHASCMLEPHTVLVTGGFGTPVASQINNPNSQQHQHGRVSECALLKFTHTSDNKDLTPELEPIPLAKFPTNQIRLDRVHGQVSKIGDMLFFNGGRQSPKGFSSLNGSFVAKVDPEVGLVLIESLSNKQQGYRWRHRQLSIGNSSILEVGGISTLGLESEPIIMWDFSSSKLGSRALALPKFSGSNELANKTIFQRHSFGLDLTPNKTTLFLWGGLQTVPGGYDKPVGGNQAKLIWDMRANTAIDINKKQPNDNTTQSPACYGANIHFISDNQVLRVGGIDSTSGQEFSYSKRVELFDLRNFNSVYLNPNIEGQSRVHTLTNATSCKLDLTNEVVTIGGGGNYFTFGTCFQDSHLIYRCV